MKLAFFMFWNFTKVYWSRFLNCLSAGVFFAIKIRTIPRYWDVSYQPDGYGYGRLLLIHYEHYENKKEDAPIVSFVEVCRKIEGLNINLTKEFQEYVGISASSGLVKYLFGGFTIDIRQCQYDKCDIEWTEEIVKKPKLGKLCAELIK